MPAKVLVGGLELLQLGIRSGQCRSAYHLNMDAAYVDRRLYRRKLRALVKLCTYVSPRAQRIVRSGFV